MSTDDRHVTNSATWLQRYWPERLQRHCTLNHAVDARPGFSQIDRFVFPMQRWPWFEKGTPFERRGRKATGL